MSINEELENVIRKGVIDMHETNAKFCRRLAPMYRGKDGQEALIFLAESFEMSAKKAGEK
jgi:hypothetical protein